MTRAEKRIARIARGHATELDLSECDLTAIPDSLTQLTDLQHLSVSNNELTLIPESLIRLTNLGFLYLSDNKLAAIPESLAQLSNLQHLDLSGNQLTAIPESLAQLSNLRTLYLARNQITTIPDSFARLTNLQFLYLDNNQLSDIPDSLAELPKLKILRLHNNPLPAEWQAAIQRDETIPYLRSLANTVTNTSPRTVKVILLGEPRSGKTTLREALQGNPRPCDPTRPETIGVDIVPLFFPHPNDNELLQVNIWDFAGQQIEHATHQFFLTPGAIYLILWNSRQGPDSGKRDVYYWLELLRMRVPGARFLLIATHADRTPPDLPWPDIQRLSGPAFAGHYDVDFATLRGFPEVQSALLQLAAESPSMNSRWNRHWLNVRDEIRRMRKSTRYLTPTQFQALLTRHKVTDPEAQKTLAGQLHELGEIIYHLDRPDLSDYVLLDCEWVTELIGLVSRSQLVRDNGGILLRQHLDTLWPQDDVPLALRHHLLKLMDAFDLSYETRQPDELAVVVEALPPNPGTPLPEWDAAAHHPELSLVFDFPNLYRRLPPGIPTWGIARAFRHSLQKPYRNLALFQHKRDGHASLGLLRADELQRKIHLRVRSPYPVYFHSILTDILRDTIARYEGLTVETSVPCQCAPTCEHAFPLNFLLQSLAEGDPFIRCQKTGAKQLPQKLLTGHSPTLPFPAPADNIAVMDELRRQFTAQRRGDQNYHESTCPNVFTFHPRRTGFQNLETLTEYLKNGEQWQLSLFCESDEEWHLTEHSLYEFALNSDLLETLRPAWNAFATHASKLTPLLKLLPPQYAIPAIPNLPTIPTDHRKLQQDLTPTYHPTHVDIELRRTLDTLLSTLDATRPPKQKIGGLHKMRNEDGRVLWLCPTHYNKLQSRTTPPLG